MKEISAELDLSRIQRDLVYDFELNESQDWVLELLKELNENSGLESEDFLPKSKILIKGTLKKTSVATFQDIGLVSLEFKAEYLSQSVKDLEIIPQALHYEVNLCFIHESFENDEAYKDETELFLEGKMHELYFTKKGKANLKEAVHEQTFLNFNFYPRND